MLGPMRNLHILQRGADTSLALTCRHILVVKQRQLHVLEHREVIDEIEALKDEPDAVPAQHRELAFAPAGDVLVREPVFTAGGAVEHAHDVQQRGFATARWPHDGDEFAPCNLQIETAQGHRLDLGGAIDLGNTLQRQHVSLRIFPLLVAGSFPLDPLDFPMAQQLDYSMPGGYGTPDRTCVELARRVVFRDKFDVTEPFNECGEIGFLGSSSPDVVKYCRIVYSR
jgi:hypothetical protein